MFEARIAPTPKDVVLREGRGSVYRFRGAASAGSHVPVLLVPSMISRWYVLDLREGASLAAALSAGAPWDTFCFDWGTPEDEDRYVTWDDLVDRLDRVVRRVLRMTGAPKIALVGNSMGATLSGIFAAQSPERVAAFVNLTGPFDFTRAGRLGAMTDPRWFDADAMTAAGNLPALQMYGGFLALSPTRPLAQWIRLLDEIDHAPAREEYAALHALEVDKVPFPGTAYATYIKELYQENRLVRGEHVVRGTRVDLGRISCPVLSIVAERDVVCPANAVTALNDHVSSDVRDVLFVPGGHVGSIVGRKAAKVLYPQMRSWLERHATRASARTPESRL